MCKALTKLFSVFEPPSSRFSRLPRWLHALLPDRWERPRPFSLLLSQRTLGNEKADLLRGRGGGVALLAAAPLSRLTVAPWRSHPPTPRPHVDIRDSRRTEKNYPWTTRGEEEGGSCCRRHFPPPPFSCRNIVPRTCVM